MLLDELLYGLRCDSTYLTLVPLLLQLIFLLSIRIVFLGLLLSKIYAFLLSWVVASLDFSKLLLFLIEGELMGLLERVRLMLALTLDE